MQEMLAHLKIMWENGLTILLGHQECAYPGDIEEVLREGGVEGLLGGQSPRPHLLVDQQSYLRVMVMVC